MGDRQALYWSRSLAGFASYPNRLICVHRLPRGNILVVIFQFGAGIANKAVEATRRVEAAKRRGYRAESRHVFRC